MIGHQQIENFTSSTEKIGNEAENEVTYRVVNLYAEHCHIYFFADPPHLLKTSNNCLHNSECGLQCRLMWNDEKTLVWSHIMQLYNDDLIRGLHLAPKLTKEHVYLKPYSKMKVYLATQVLSYTVAKVLCKWYPSDYHATAEICEILDFFLIAAISEIELSMQEQGKNPANLIAHKMMNAFLGWKRNS